MLHNKTIKKKILKDFKRFLKILKDFKKTIKSGDTSLGKFVAEVLIFRISRSQMFFKVGALKDFAILRGNHLCWPLQAFFNRTPTVAASGFSK